jgi:hypothetical protein
MVDSGIAVYVWDTWTSGTSSSATTDSTWRSWTSTAGTTTGNIVYYYELPVRTPEETAAENRRQEESLAAGRKLAQEKLEADKKAEELLVAHLDKKQKKYWKERQEFIVLSETGRQFLIRNARNKNVRELDTEGKRLREFCIVAPEVPIPDQLLMQKLMLEHSEAEFLRTANMFQ